MMNGWNARGVVGWGADRAPKDRPGNPKEITPPKPIGNAHWVEPDAQVSGPIVAKDATRPVTPTYGTVIPPRGLSGAIRRVAYGIPGYKPRRWMLLLLADRIDVLEHNPARLATILGGVAAIALGLAAVKRFA
jgi:hypothetical protein